MYNYTINETITNISLVRKILFTVTGMCEYKKKKKEKTNLSYLYLFDK